MDSREVRDVEASPGRAVDWIEDMSEALIEIASAFAYWSPAPGVIWADCVHCHHGMHSGCAPECPGLKARKALGIG